MTFFKSKKRHFILLEVLIAFAIAAMCLLPLIYPHTAMLKAQHNFIRTVELDHIVNLLYANILEKLYLNRINWNDILENNIEIKEDLLKEIGVNKPFYFTGSYNFNEVSPKHKSAKSGYSHYYLTLTFNFYPKSIKNNSEKLLLEPIKYQYKVFIVKDPSPVIQGASTGDGKP